jgi:peptide chain release factor
MQAYRENRPFDPGIILLEEYMILQISSGQGPAECEIAVCKLYEALKTEYPDIEMLNKHEGRKKGCWSSVIFSTDADLSDLEGSVQWICPSPYRLHHKRKNWFVDVSIIPELENVCTDQEIRFERFHCGGKGGQNVNKVETGVRLIHIPTGITVTSTSQRSQLQNRQEALQKLKAILMEKQQTARASQKNDAWREHTRIVRGNPIRVYEGMAFRRKS